MRNANVYCRFAVKISIFDIPPVLSVFFSGNFFGNFRVIGGDTEHERIFLLSDPLHADGIKRETKKRTP